MGLWVLEMTPARTEEAEDDILNLRRREEHFFSLHPSIRTSMAEVQGFFEERAARLEEGPENEMG